MDLIGYLSYFAFAIAHFALQEFLSQKIFVLSLGCALFRGTMTFFNLFESTRYLVQMSIGMMKDLIPFLCLLFGQVLIFAILHIQLNKTGIGEEFIFIEDDHSGEVEYTTLENIFLISFAQTWDSMLGYGSQKLKTPMGILIYFLATIFINIGMLNMVISVVSDSYDRVQTDRVEQDYIAKSNLLYEYL